jgi:hypothetical protein
VLTPRHASPHQIGRLPVTVSPVRVIRWRKARKCPPRQAAEPLWSVRLDGRQIDAELRGHGEYGWEFQLLHDREFYAGRRFDLRAQAVAHGEEIRRELEQRGWREAS